MSKTAAFRAEWTIPDALQPVADLAVTRAQYLFPQAHIARVGSAVQVEADTHEGLEETLTQLRYTVYREHCSQRDVTLRDVMTRALFS